MKLERIKIGELGKVKTGTTPPTNRLELYGNYIPFIKPSDIEVDKRFTPSPSFFHSELGAELFQKFLVPKGSTCVVTIGSIGEKITQAETDCFTNQQINAVIPNEFYNCDYVFYLLKHNLYRVKGANQGSSSGRENVAKSTFVDIDIEVTKHLPTQRKIASILSAYDDLIENNLKRIKLLEEATEIVFKTEFDFFKPSNEVNKLPDGWRVQRADEIFRINIGKTPPREQDEWFNDPDSGIKWVSIKDINNSTVYMLNTSETVTENAVNKFNMNVAKIDTVILSFKLTVGKVAITTEEMVTNEAIAHFNIDDETRMNSEFIYFYLKNFPYDSLGSTSSIGTAINSKIVKAMPVLLPPKSVIQDFGKKVKPSFQMIKTLLKQNTKLREARDILLPKLMSGQIEV